VVDDNATNRRILQELLTGWRMRPTLVDSGAAALAVLDRAWASNEDFGLILLDSQMPEMDGFALAARLRDHPHCAEATIMMLTSSDQSGDAARCHGLGVTSYLVKPISPSDLLSAIIAALRISTEKGRARPSTHNLKVDRTGPALRILLAEDNPINQVVATQMIRSQGHDVVVANSGKEALDLIARESFDVVLMHIQMPEMDGFEATQALRAQERQTGEHLPVIAMTAHA